MTLHNALANSELHEDKGVAEATDMQAYVADGGGSGEWVSPLVEVVGTWDYSTDVGSVEFEGLGDYAILQIDLVGITLASNTDQYIYGRIGNDSGFVSSAVYHSSYWSSNNNGSVTITGIPLGYHRNASPASGLNFSSTLLTNFNIDRYKTACSQTSFDESTTTGNGFYHWDTFIRNNSAMNKFRVTASSSFTGGSIIISGYRYKV